MITSRSDPNIIEVESGAISPFLNIRRFFEIMKGKAIVASRKTKVANNGAIDAANGKIVCSGYFSDCRY